MVAVTIVAVTPLQELPQKKGWLLGDGHCVRILWKYLEILDTTSHFGQSLINCKIIPQVLSICD